MKKKIVFVISFAHSGSTLTDKIMGNHPDMFSLGEIERYNEVVNKPHNICGCGDEYADCSFWNSFFPKLNAHVNDDVVKNAKAFPTVTEVDVKSSLKRMLLKTMYVMKAFVLGSTHKKYETSVKNMGQMYHLLMEESGKNVLVDSSKNIFRALLTYKLLRKEFDVKILFLVRDGRAVMQSFQKKKSSFVLDESKGEVKQFEIKKFSNSVLVNGWVRQNLFCLTLLKLFVKKKDLFQAKYEDVTLHPSSMLKQIVEWIGLDYKEKMLDLKSNVNHMMGGHPSRVNAKTINPPSYSWKKELPQEVLDLFNSRGGWLNKYLGYK
ncbi:MAG: hypothetical protein ACI94Y_000469 [Maribacter sp.]|jgi:hypothetical protein